TAGAEFAGLLGQFRGDPLRAESAYQTGPNAPYNPAGEGVGVFTSLGIGGPQTGYGITPGAGSDATLLSSSSSSSPSVQTGWPGGDLTLVPSSPLFGGVHISKSTLFRSVLMIVGLLLLLIAFNAVAKGRTDAGPISLTREAANDTADSAGDTSDGPSNVPPSRLQSDREATQRWELLNRQHKAQSAIVERTKKAQAQDQADEDVAHAEHQAAANEADPRYQAGAAQFKRNAADRRRHGNATLRRGEDVAKADVKGAPAAAAAL
ncbi:MAG: hypothetical protein ACREQ5_11770, partial [Candidatus Dormibacteria bacterium]